MGLVLGHHCCERTRQLDLAKADALDDMGERHAAHELILQSLRPPPGFA
ncbi:MAG TPA: hypothetical protein VIM45_01345 [Dehalococcoidia bacterium]|jgi:hypothetical protein